MSNLSNEQYYALVLVLIVSATLSVMGSSAIIIAARKNIGSIYQRMVFSLSVADLLSSVSLMVHPFLMPKGTPGLPWASGNDQSCSAMGFFFTIFKSTVSVYSAYSSVYFLLKVRYNKNDRFIVTRCEIPAHVLATIPPLALATAGVATDSYAPRPFIKLCALGDCVIGEDLCEEQNGLSWFLAWTAGFFVILPTLAAVVCTIAVYWSVRASLRKNRRYSFGGEQTNNGRASAQLQAVRAQAIFYALAYLNSVIFVAMIGIIADEEIQEREGDPWLFFLQLLAWTMFPLQGCLNFLVYSRPRYLQWRDMFPDKPRLFAIRKTLSLEPVNLMTHLRRRSTFRSQHLAPPETKRVIPNAISSPDSPQKEQSGSNKCLDETKDNSDNSPSSNLENGIPAQPSAAVTEKETTDRIDDS